MTPNLIETYRQIIACAGWEADAEGYISVKLADMDPQPVLVDGKRLVLPLDHQLKYPDAATRVVFHPLNESILRGESDVTAKLRQHINQRLNFVIGFVAFSLMRLATSPAEHPSLKPQQTVFLSKVKEADEQTLEKMQKIAAQMLVGDPSKAFAHIYVSKRGDIDGRKYARVGTVSFPLYEELLKSEMEVYGIKLRKKDKASIKALLEYMLPDLDHPSTYRRGSDSKVAPTLDALMKAVISVGEPINDTIELFKDMIDGGEDLMFNGEWEPVFQDLEVLLAQIRLIPMQAGNEGRAGHQAGMAAANIPVVNLKTAGAAPAGVQTAVAQAEQAQAPAPAPSRPRTLSEINSKALDAEVKEVASRPAQPAPYPKTIVTPQPQPGVVPGTSFTYGAAQQQQPQVVNTGNGLSMDSIVRSNPALAARAASMGFGPQQQQFFGTQQPQQRQSSYMQPNAQNFGTTTGWNNFSHNGFGRI